MVHALSEVRIEALPQDIPHQIDVDLSKIEQIEDTLYVRDLVVDASKIEILNDGDAVVAKAVAPRAEEEVKPAAVAAEGEAALGEAAEEGAAPAAAGASQPHARARPLRHAVQTHREGSAAPRSGET